MVCAGFPPKVHYCALGFVVRTLPLCAWLYLIGFHVYNLFYLKKSGARKIPFVIVIEGLFASIFYWGGLLPVTSERAAGVEFVCFFFFEAAGMTLFLSWRLVDQVVAQRSRNSARLEIVLLATVAIVTGVLLLILLPITVLAATEVIDRGILDDIFYVHGVIGVLLLLCGVLWSVRLARTVSKMPTDQLIRKAVPRMKIVLMILLGFLVQGGLYVCALSLQTNEIDTEAFIVITEMGTGLTLQIALIYSQWSATPSCCEQMALLSKTDTTEGESVSLAS